VTEDSDVEWVNSLDISAAAGACAKSSCRAAGNGAVLVLAAGRGIGDEAPSGIGVLGPDGCGEKSDAASNFALPSLPLAAVPVGGFFRLGFACFGGRTDVPPW
jgi:hypothetical protein